MKAAHFFRSLGFILISATAALAQNTLYWDINGIEFGSGDAGGTWDTATPNWNLQSDGQAEPGFFVNGDSVVFSAGDDGVTLKTVTIDGTVATSSIKLEEPGVVQLTGGSLDISGGALFDLFDPAPLDPMIPATGLGTATDRNPVWTCAITGTGDLTIEAHGSTADAPGANNSDLTLSGANDFTGTVTILSGLVNLASDFGAPANVVLLDGGGLVGEANLASALGIRFGSTGGFLRTVAGTTTTLTGAIANAPGVTATSLRHTDTGTLKLAGDGSGFAGMVTNAGGELQVGAANADWSGAAFDLLPGGGNLTFNGTGIAKAKSINTVADHTIIDSGTVLDVPLYTIIPSAGTGIASNIGVASGSNGAITSSTGMLTIANGQFESGSLGLNGHVIYAAVRNFDGTTPLALVKNRNNSLALAGANPYSGGTTINAGRIDAQDATAFGTGKVTVNSGGQAWLSKGVVYANDFDLAGIGAAEAAATRGALRFATATTSGTVTIALGGARITAANGTLGRMNGNLTGSGALEINSNDTNVSGTVTLAGSGAGYIGTVTVRQGRFNFDGALGGSVVVAPTVTDTILGGGTSLVGSLTLDSTTKKAKYANASGILAIAGNLTLTGSNPVVLTKPAPGTTSVTLMTYGGTLTGGAANLVLDNAASYRGTPAFTAGAGVVGITGLDGQNLVWSGATGAWNIETAANWNNGTATFSFGDAVTFTDAGTTKNVTMVAGLEPYSVTVANSAGNEYTFSSGGLAGSTGITKSGTGTLTLGGTSTFTGAVQVTGGKLKITTGTALGLNSGIAIAPGGQVDLNGQSPGGAASIVTGGYTYTIRGDGDGTGAIVNSGAALADAKAGVRVLNLTADASIGTGSRFDIGYDTKAGTGSVNGGGFTLTKKGSGEIRFRAPASSFNLVVEAGSVVAQDLGSAFGGASGSVSVAGAAQVGIAGALAIPTPVALADGATIISGGGGTGQWSGLLTSAGALNVTTAGGEIAVVGGIAGTGTLTKTGSSALILDGASNPFAGKIVVAEGSLRVASDAALGAPPATLVPDAITLAGGTLAGGTVAGAGSATIGHPNRGITTTAGYTWASPAGTMLTINSPVTTPGNTTVTTGGTTFNGGLDLTTGTGTAEIIVQNNGTAGFGGPANPSILHVMTGTLVIADGAAVTTGRLMTNDADQTVGTVNHTGGTLTITGTSNTNDNQASIQLGHWPSTGFNYNLSGGTFHAPATLMSLGWDSVNVNINQTGGTANLLGININNTRANPASYNLNGGRLNLGAAGINTNTAKTINLGGGTLGAFADWSSGQPMNLTGTGGNVSVNTLDSVDNATPRTIVLTGALSGTGGLVKQSAGTLVLDNAASSFSGTAAVAGGTLFINATATTAATFKAATGGTLRAGTPAAAGTATSGTLEMDGGTALFRIGTATDKITAPSLAVTSASTIAVIPTQALTAPSSYTVVDYTGAIGGLGLAGLSLALPNPHYSGTLVEDATNTVLKVNITAADSVIWRGSTNGTWDVDATANWVLASNGTTPTKFYAYDVVRFNDGGLSRPTLTLAGTIQPAVVTVENTTGTYTFQGDAITGATGLTKSGNGTLVLANANTYTGGTTLTGGTLALGAAGALGTSGTISMNGGALRFTEANTTDYSGRLAMVNGKTATFDTNGANVAFATAIGNATSAALAKNGAGVLALAARATYTGGTTVNGGILDLTGGGGAEGTIRGTVNINNGGILRLSTGDATGYSLTNRLSVININEGGTMDINIGAASAGGAAWNQTLGGAVINMTGGTMSGMTDGNLDFFQGGSALNTLASAITSVIKGTQISPLRQGNTTFTVADGPAAVDLRIDSVMRLAPSGGDPVGAVLIKAGAGTLQLNAANTIERGIRVDAGTLAVSAAGSLAAGPLTVKTGATLAPSGSGTLCNALTLDAGAHLAIALAASPGAQAHRTVAGAMTVNAGSILDLTAAATPVGGDYTLIAATSLTTMPGTVNLPAGVTGTLKIVGGSLVLTVEGAAGYDAWATTNAGGQTADLDFDGDGVPNGVEFFLGATGSSFTANPGVVNGKVTWPKSADFQGTYAVETSPDLAAWTPASVGVVDKGTSVEYTLPTGEVRIFVRLLVTPQ